MKLRTPLTALIGLTLATGCDSSGSSSSVATVTGRYVAGSGGASGQAELVAVDDDGPTGLIASGALSADGTFTLEVPPDAGPFIVQIRGNAGAEVVGSALLPYGIDEGERLTTVDIDAESSAEVAAYLAIIAGEATADDIDGVGLMTWIDARLAAEGDATRLGAAWMQYQAGFMATINAERQRLDAAAMTALSAELHKEFTARADFSGELTFHRELAAELAAKASYDAQVDARLAAAALGAMALTGDAAEFAAEAGAELSAHAAWASQSAASAEASVRARLDTAYEGFFGALANGEAMANAQAELAASLGGDGQVGIGSALSLAASADGVSAAELRQAMSTASSSIAAKIEAAFSGASSARVDAVASAIIEARSEARAHFENRLGANATARLASELFVVTSHTEGLLSIDLITSTIGLALQGTLGADLSGAAEIVAVIATTLSGELIAEGTVSGVAFTLSGITSADLAAPFVVAATDAAGQWRGAMIVNGAASVGGVVTLGQAISAESTAAARVAVELVARGETDASALAMLELMSEAESGIVASWEEATALAAALDARAAFDAAAQQLDAELSAFASSAFEARAAITAAGEAAWRFELLTRVEAALAVSEAAEAELDAERFDAVRSEVELAVDVFVAAAANAGSSVEADNAWAAFNSSMDTVIDTSLIAALGITGGGQLAAQLTDSLAAAVDARSDFEGALSAAFAGGDTNVEVAAAAVASAAASWQTALSGSLDLSFLVHLVAADQAAAAAFMGAAHVWLGR